MVFLLKKIQKLYEIRDDLLRIYSLKPDYNELETVKRQYIENSNEDGFQKICLYLFLN